MQSYSPLKGLLSFLCPWFLKTLGHTDPDRDCGIWVGEGCAGVADRDEWESGGSFKRLDEFGNGALWNARVATAVSSYMYSSSPGEKPSEQVNNHI